MLCHKTNVQLLYQAALEGHMEQIHSLLSIPFKFKHLAKAYCKALQRSEKLKSPYPNKMHNYMTLKEQGQQAQMAASFLFTQIQPFLLQKNNANKLCLY